MTIPGAQLFHSGIANNSIHSKSIAIYHKPISTFPLGKHRDRVECLDEKMGVYLLSI